jgi:Tfp pilus assembly protein PilN
MLASLANTVVSTKTMWLTTFENTADKVHMTGFATSAETVADFLRNLKDTGQFTNVELKDTSEDDDADRGFVAFKFEVSAQLTNVAQVPQMAGGKK